MTVKQKDKLIVGIKKMINTKVVIIAAWLLRVK